MSKKLAEVEDQLVKLRQEQNALRAEEFMCVTAPKIRAAIGKCFVYRNNSCGGNEKWDEFRRLIGAEISEGSASLIFEQVALTQGRKATIGIEVGFIGHFNGDGCIGGPGWQPCTNAEYVRERKLTLGQIENPTILKQYLRSE